MASPTPLHDTELVDCARANANQGIETAAYQDMILKLGTGEIIAPETASEL